jgi:hypothetical protein
MVVGANLQLDRLAGPVAYVLSQAGQQIEDGGFPNVSWPARATVICVRVEPSSRSRE